MNMENFKITCIHNLSELQELNNLNRYNILYGAGNVGQKCLKILQDQGITIDYFCDDDKTKWGIKINEVEVIPSSSLNTFDKEINLAITSIYAKRIYKRLPNVDNIFIYELFQIYGADKGLAEQIPLLSDKEISKVKNKLVTIESIFKDDTSKKTLKTLGGAILSKTTDINYIRPIASSEDCYFIKEIIDSFDDELNVIDAGAYTGELIGNIAQLSGMRYNKIYCFEVESTNYSTLLKNTNGVNGITCVNKGLWESDGIVYIEGSGTATKIVDYETDYKIEVVSIDNYFINDSINFIKMDIEGSEMKALKGGGKVIKRDRPILAISIYHSVQDFTDIPLFLYDLLENYHFYLRHHSMIFAETVFYCIPNEKLKT